MWQFTFVAALAAAAAYIGLAGALAHLGVPLPAPPLRWRLPVAWMTAAVASLAAVAVTAPQGLTLTALLIGCYAVALSIALIARGLRMPRRQGAELEVFTRTARWIAAALLAASGAWAMISPRSDQPALDAIERTFPAVRAAYMGDEGAARADEAQVRAAREANRWGIGLAFLVLAGSVLVSLPRSEPVPRS